MQFQIKIMCYECSKTSLVINLKEQNKICKSGKWTCKECKKKILVCIVGSFDNILFLGYDSKRVMESFKK